MRLPKRKEYPKYVHLRGDTYRLKFKKNFKHLGETDATKCVVTIRKGMSRKETFRTFMHEMLHVIEFSWPINLKHKTIYKIEKALYHFIMDNFI